MKPHTLLLAGTAALFLTLIGSACQRKMSAPSSPSVNQEIMSFEDQPILVGQVNRAGLSGASYGAWFTPNYNGYRVDEATLLPFVRTLRSMDILLFMGTWCEDSQAQVPQFFRILDWAGFDESQLTVVALDNHPDRYKQSPQHEEQGWNIESVPTFILRKDGQEIGRIVEYPTATLEKDLAGILAGYGRE